VRDEISAAFQAAVIRDGEIYFEERRLFEPGATWTYLTTDQPFGTLSERIAKGVRRAIGRHLS